jgi:protein-S-isoprenylcysteine O-methyltransferase Ste14
VIGLYIAYAIPIYLRWRQGRAFEQSPVWNLGNKWRWMNPFAVFWVGLITIIFCLPFTPAAVPWNDEFSWESVNYAPLTVGAVLIFAALSWHLRAKHYFTGQVKNIEIDAALSGEGEQPKSTP